MTSRAAPGFRYQAGDDSVCLPPSAITPELPIRKATLVDRALPAATPKTP